MPGGALVSALQTGLRPAWRRAVVARGRDVTADAGSRSCLVVAPHPDDETLGCGATIARKRAAGTAVHIVVVADGHSSHRSAVMARHELVAIRAAEAVEAARRLGVPPSCVTLLAIPDGTVADHHAELHRRLGELLDACTPSDVLVCSPLDWHPDHFAVNAATRKAVQCRGGGRPRLLEYPVWYWAEGPWLRRPHRAVRRKLIDLAQDPLRSLRAARPEIVRADKFLEVKRHALAAHRTQMENVTGEPAWAVFDRRFLRALLSPVEVFWPVP